MNCSKCGKIVNPGDKYCKSCGSLIEVKEDNTLAIISLVFGILSIVVALPVAIIGLILGICQKGKSGLKTAGIVINSISIALKVIVIILLSLFMFNLTSGIINNSGVKDIKEKFINGISFEEEKYNDWNQYNNLKEDVSNNKSLEGGWRVVGDGNSYVVLKDGNFYIYEDINDKENNFMSGTYELSGIDDDLDKVKRSIDIITGEDKNLFNNFNFIVFTPTKVVKEGMEQDVVLDSFDSVWMIIDHEDGIEAIVEFDDHEDISDNYIKVED